MPAFRFVNLWDEFDKSADIFWKFRQDIDFK